MNGDTAIKRETKPAKGRPENNKTPINDQIKAREVRLIDAEGTQVGVVPLSEALAAAQAAQLDLVQITDGDPLVCKIMDFGKKIFEDKKARNLAKKKQVQSQVKEMKFRPGTDEGDYQVKLRNLIRFLEHGDKAKVTLRFRGREMAHQELGMKLLQRIEEDLKAYGVVEMHPKMEGRQLTMMLAPQKKK